MFFRQYRVLDMLKLLYFDVNTCSSVLRFLSVKFLLNHVQMVSVNNEKNSEKSSDFS